MRRLVLIAVLSGCTGVDDDSEPGDVDSDSDVVDTDRVDTGEPCEGPACDGIIVTLQTPLDGSIVTSGSPIGLSAVVTALDGSAVDDAELRWTDAVDGAITDPYVPSGLGSHTITVSADWRGRIGADSATVSVVSPDPQFTLHDAAAGIPSDLVWDDLWADPSTGLVYAATSQGLLRFDGTGRFYGLADGVLSTTPVGVLVDRDGSVWVGLSSVTANDAQRLVLDANGDVTSSVSVNIDLTHEIVEMHRFREVQGGTGDGDVWIGTNEGLCIWDRDLDVYAEHLHPTHPHDDTLGLAVGADGDAWNGDQYQLSRWRYDHDGTVSSVSNLVDYDHVWPVDPSVPVQIVGLTFRGTDLWVASDLYGVARIDTTAASIATGVTYPVPELTSATAIAAHPDGTVWVGTPAGLFRIGTDGSVTPFGQDLFTVAVQQIAIDPVSGIGWLGTSAGLIEVDP